MELLLTEFGKDYTYLVEDSITGEHYFADLHDDEQARR